MAFRVWPIKDRIHEYTLFQKYENRRYDKDKATRPRGIPTLLARGTISMPNYADLDLPTLGIDAVEYVLKSGGEQDAVQSASANSGDEATNATSDARPQILGILVRQSTHLKLGYHHDPPRSGALTGCYSKKSEGTWPKLVTCRNLPTCCVTP